MIRVKRTAQPCFSARVGPLHISVFRPERTNTRGTHQGWCKDYWVANVAHVPLEFELLDLDGHDYSTTEEELRANVVRDLEHKLPYFTVQITAPEVASLIARLYRELTIPAPVPEESHD